MVGRNEGVNGLTGLVLCLAKYNLIFVGLIRVLDLKLN
jgi:hypothetical protein